MTKWPRQSCLAAVLSLALAACGGKPQPAPAAAPAAGERFTVRQQMVPDLKPVVATITTKRMADARARIGGVLTRLEVKEGDLVRRGQLIGMVTDQRIGLETRALDAQVAAAQAENVRAQADLSRIRKLYDQGIYAKARLDQAQAASGSASGALAAARAQRAASAESGAQGAILAPDSGRVLHADVPVGSVVTAGESVATITAGPAVIRVEIPEADARLLKVGQTVPLMRDDLEGGLPAATIVQIYPSVAAGRIVADLTADGLNGQFVGQRVRTRLPIGERPALIAPAAFIVTRFGMDYARVLTRGGSANDAPVQLAPGPGPGQVEVLSGLKAGDVLVRPGPVR